MAENPQLPLTEALARFTVIGPLLARDPEHPLQERLAAAAANQWPWPDGTYRQFGVSTIETWYYAYRHGGLEALARQPRADRGQSRVLPPALATALAGELTAHPRLKVRHLLRGLRTRGELPAASPSDSTLYRYLAQLRRTLPPLPGSRERLAFEAPYPGALWQGDLMYGPHLPLRQDHGPKRRSQTYLLALLDDHTRLCAHGAFYGRQDLAALLDVFEAACRKRGVPERLYVDNGLIFSGRQLRTVCARLGTVLSHTRVRDAAAKGKIERFFQTVRSSFLEPLLELTPPANLEALNRAFLQWVESDYHRRPHGGLDGATPLDRWLAGASHVRPLPDDGRAEHAFLLSVERLVRQDHTVSFAGRWYEVPDARPGTRVELRYHLAEPQRLHAYAAGVRLGVARPLNREANYHLPRRTANPPPPTEA